MSVIVADVGGTNTRVARSTGGALDQDSIRWFRNDDYPSFADVLTAYGTATAQALIVAVAGPVTDRRARLTNRDWVIDADLFQFPVTIVNDLQAVGYALDRLGPDALAPICEGGAPLDAQRLVVGVGTGFNVSFVAGPHVLRAELGHATLPTLVADWLTTHLGKMPFASIEALFSGSGLERLHHALTGSALSSQRIVAEAPETLRLFAEGLGVMATQLVYGYMPIGGIYLNGGLARALMGRDEGRAGFVKGFDMDPALGGQVSGVPVHLVIDDAAALYGCAKLSGQS